MTREERTSKPTAEVVQAKYQEASRGPDALELAATCIEKKDLAGAVAHFKRHLREHPDQVMIRAYLAELLLKMKKFPDAQEQYELFIADAQEGDAPLVQHLLHCHTRLMEIAQERDDDYAEHLHRGIGMVLLVRRFDSLEAGEQTEPGFRERLLCKAAGELNRARDLRTDEPRPHWYLVEVLNKLGQARSAEKSLKQAKSLAALVPLPRAEQRSLCLKTSSNELSQRSERP